MKPSVEGGIGTHEAGPEGGRGEEGREQEEREDGEQDPVGEGCGGGPGVLEGEEGAEGRRKELLVVMVVREER